VKNSLVLPDPQLGEETHAERSRSGSRPLCRADWWHVPPGTTLPSRALRALHAGDAIRANPPGGADIVFAPRWLTMLALPRKRAAPATEFRRQAGPCSLVIRPSSDGRASSAAAPPYGSASRLTLICLATIATRRGSSKIATDDLLAEYLRAVGSGDPKEHARSLRKQVTALANCDFNISVFDRAIDGKLIHPEPTISALNGTSRESFRPQWIELTRGFFTEKSGLALDRRAVAALRASPFALDMYLWMSQHMDRMDGGPKFFNWDYLLREFGDCYTAKDAKKDFKKAFLVTLRDVLTVYPRARVFVYPHKLMLLPSPLPVRARDADAQRNPPPSPTGA
jgi:hypothetical protein